VSTEKPNPAPEYTVIGLLSTDVEVKQCSLCGGLIVEQTTHDGWHWERDWHWDPSSRVATCPICGLWLDPEIAHVHPEA
jgi:hypothetical protein